MPPIKINNNKNKEKYMSTFVTSVGGRTVEICRIGAPGPPGASGEIPEYTVITERSGVNVIDTVPILEARSIAYDIQLASEGGYQFAQLNLIHDDFSVYVTQLGDTLVDQPVGTFLAEIVDGNIVLSCDVIFPETYINFKKNTLSNSGSHYVPFPGDLMLMDYTIDLEYDDGADIDLMTI